MPIKLFDRVKQKTTTAGSGNVTLTSSVASFVDFSGVYTDNDQLYYTIENLTDFEVGIGTYSGNTLSRDQVLKSSNSDNLLNLPGDANTFIYATYPASGAVYTSGDRIVTNVDAVDFTPLSNGNQPSYLEGRVFYDNENKALSVYNDEADITLQLGQEEYLRVRNNTSNIIANGEAVFITGSQGTWPEVAPAIASNEPQSHVIGLATHEIGVSSFGYVTTYGIVRDVDTSDFSDGDEVYLSSEISGGLTGVSPTAPNYKSAVGHVIRSHPSNGTILVVIEPPKLGGGDVKSLGNFQQSGIAFIDLIAGSDAAIISSNTGLSYDSGNQILQVDAGGVRFPDGATQTIAYTGQTQDLSSYATTSYVNTVSGNLQTQITSNDGDISTLQANDTIISGIAQGAADDVVTVSGLIPTYTAASGITLEGSTFTMSGDGNLESLNFTANDGILASGNNDVRLQIISTDIFMGYLAGTGLLDGNGDNIAIGYAASQSASSCLDTIAIGTFSMETSRLCDYTIAIGYQAGNSSLFQDYGIGIGYQANLDVDNSVYINSIGYRAGNSANADYTNNFGYEAGMSSNGNYNIFLGYRAGKSLVGSNNVEIVTQGATSSIIGSNSNKLNIESTIIGDTSSKLLAIGNVSSGNLTPDATLEILPNASTDIGLIVQGAAAHNANLQEWQDSAGNTLAYVDAGGNASFSGLTALGNLEVSGTLTYISSTNVTIADKQLELASDSGSPISGDAGVDQGGIVLKSTNGDKEWLWTDATDAWTSNQNIDVGSNSVIFDGISQTIAFTGYQDLTPYATTGDLDTVSGIAQGAADDVVTVSGLIPTYTAGSGITLEGSTFTMSGTGTLSKLNFDSESVFINNLNNANIARSVVIGHEAGGASNNIDSVIIGHQAATGSSSNDYCVIVGQNAGKDAASCSLATMVGWGAGQSAVNNDESVNIGFVAGYGVSSSNNLIAIGSYAGYQTNQLDYGVNIGYEAGFQMGGFLNQYGNMIGYQAGYQSSGSYNNYIGYRAGRLAGDGTRNIEIVTQGATTSVIGANSNKLHIENTIIGDTSSKLIAIGNVTAANLTPDATLEILPAASTDVGLIVQGAAAQSANLQEWQDSAGAVLANVNPQGTISGSGFTFPDGVTQTVAYTGQGGTTYTASDGILLNGNNFLLDGTGNLSKLTINNGTDSALNVSGSTLIAGTGVVFEVQNTGGTALFAVEDSTEVQVIVAAQPAQTGNPFEVRDAFDDTVAYVDVSGNISGNNISFGDGTTQTTAAGPASVISDSNTGITIVCATHANSYLRTTSNSGVTITFPSGVGCDANSEFTFEQAGSGQITVTGEAGVTINTSSTTKSYTQFSVISLKQVATDTYTLFGDTASF